MKVPQMSAERGPTIGGCATIVVCSEEPEIDPHVKALICDRATRKMKKQIVAFDDTAPRRGPNWMRQQVFLSVRLAKGVKLKDALKAFRGLIRQVRTSLDPYSRRAAESQRELARLSKRAERRAVAQATRSARGTKPSQLPSFKAAFGLS